MSGKSGNWLSVMVFGLAVCLTIPACRTCQEKGRDAGEVSVSSDATNDTIRKLNEVIIPEMTFFPPATIIDAVDFLKQASRDYDKPGTPPEQRGVSFVLKLPRTTVYGTRELVDPFAEAASTNCVAPLLGAIAVRAISLHDALQLVCNVTDMRFHIQEGGGVMLVPEGWDLEEDWATCSFNIPPALSERLFKPSHSQAPDADPNKVWQAFFNELGVTGPDFAKVDYLPSIGKLRVTNTLENLAIIESVFDTFAERLVEVEMQIHAFRAKDIECLRLAAGVSVESLTALRQEGKSKPVATATALTKSGQEATVKAVREVLYPTELLTDGGHAGSNVTSRSTANALMPGSYETREAGMILQVVPDVTLGESVINLMLNPTWVTLEGWESYPADLAAGWAHKTFPFRQPVFGATSFQTQVSVLDGGTVLLGSCSTPDGEWVQVGFLTARLQNTQVALSPGGLVHAVRDQRERCLGKNRTKDEILYSSVKQKMYDIIIPELEFRPPVTIIDAVRFFKEAGVKYDKTGGPEAQRGLNFVLKLPAKEGGVTEGGENANPFFAPVPVTNDCIPVISALSARFIMLYDALKLVCDVTGMKFRIRNGIVWIEPLSEPEGELVTRSFVLPTPAEGSFLHADETTVSGHRDMDKDWKSYFAELGVRWPEGSSITYSSLLGELRVKNTEENLAALKLVLTCTDCLPRMVEVEIQIHAFPIEDIAKLRLSGDVSVEALTALRQKGRAKPVASATVVTKSGQEAVAKSVREVLYPTELGIDGGSGALTPCSFDMRAVGMILQVVPEVSSTNPSQINLMLNPQWITLDRWETYPADLAAGWAHKTLPFRQPVFGATSFQTQATVKDGGTVLLGSSSTPDGKWVNVGFLMAKRVDVQSENPQRRRVPAQ